MHISPEQFKSVINPAQAELTQAFIDAHLADPLSGLDEAVKIIQSKKDTLSSTLSISLQRELEDKVTSKLLNVFYSTVLNDIHILYSSARDNQYTLSSLANRLDSKFKQLEQIINKQEHDLLEVRFLFNNHEYMEALSQDLSSNSELDYPINYNSKELVASLSTEESYDVAIDSIDVSFIGHPDRNIVPSYSPDKMIDNTTTTAWYEVVGYKSKPQFIIDPKLDSIQSFVVGSIYSPTPLNPGDTVIPGAFNGVSSNDEVTIGDMYSYSMEVVKVVSVTASSITTSPLKNIHYPSEPVFMGSNLIQINGACAIVELTFNYPRVSNFVRFLPLSTNALNLIGGYYKKGLSWIKIPNVEDSNLGNIKSISYEAVTTTKLRFILEQPTGKLINFQLSNSSPIDSIYEREFNMLSYNLESKLESYKPEDIRKANINNTREFLVNRTRLHNISLNLSSASNGETSTEADIKLNTLDEFSSTEEKMGKRYVYDIGISELQLMHNSYNPFSVYKSEPRPLVQNTKSYSLVAKEHTYDNTSIEHFLELDNGRRLPILNRNNLSNSGDVISNNELLDIDPLTNVAVLRFIPITSSINIDKKKDGVLISSLNLSHIGGVVTLPVGFYDSKAYYETTYTVEDPDIHVESNLISVENVDRFKGTNEGPYVELPKAPVFELGIINDSIRFSKKEPNKAVWQYNISPLSPVWVDESNIGQAFPEDSVIIDNIYYGRECTSPIKRTSGLEDFLYTMFSLYSGNIQNKVDSFFAKYEGTILGLNIEYKPITVIVNGVEALCSSTFDGNPNIGFDSTIDKTRQYIIFGNKLRFPDVLEESTDIEVRYRIKETTLAYGSILRINKKSNFNVTPILHNALIGSLL